jgi:cytochrome c5
VSCYVFFISVQGHFIKNDVVKAIKDTVSVQYSAEVKKVIDSKCYGCHSPESKAQKAKDKLNWKLLPSLSKANQVAKLDEIVEVIEKGEMPPKQFIEKKPGAKLSESDAKIIKEWAKNIADKLVNQKKFLR